MKKVTSVLLGLVFMGLMFATPRATIVKVFWEPMALLRRLKKMRQEVASTRRISLLRFLSSPIYRFACLLHC